MTAVLQPSRTAWLHEGTMTARCAGESLLFNCEVGTYFLPWLGEI